MLSRKVYILVYCIEFHQARLRCCSAISFTSYRRDTLQEISFHCLILLFSSIHTSVVVNSESTYVTVCVEWNLDDRQDRLLWHAFSWVILCWKLLLSLLWSSLYGLYMRLVWSFPNRLGLRTCLKAVIPFSFEFSRLSFPNYAKCCVQFGLLQPVTAWFGGFPDPPTYCHPAPWGST